MESNENTEEELKEELEDEADPEVEIEETKETLSTGRTNWASSLPIRREGKKQGYEEEWNDESNIEAIKE